MPHQPERLNKYYYELFVKTVKDRTPLYNGAEKRFIFPDGRAEPAIEINPAPGVFYRPPTVGSLGDYALCSKPLSRDKVDSEIEAVVCTFAQQLADSIETLVEDTSAYGTPICYDLFKLSDGSPNLQVMYVINNGTGTAYDPMSSVTGWIAYKVRYTVSTRVRAKS
jgi:hypothetical protein